MDNIAVHMRISGITVNDDDVDSRRAAATSLAASWRKERTVSKILSKVVDVAKALGGDGNPSPELGAEVQGAIQKRASSFLYEERPLEIGVCAGMAMASILAGSPTDNGWTTADVYAAALWSTLAYQPVLEADRRERLRREVLDTARNWSVAAAEKARDRIVVPDPSEVKIAIDDSGGVTHNFREAVANTVEALRRNAALDREELDFLWWAQLGRSRVLNRLLPAIPEPSRIVAAGIEGARMLRRLPCDVHREIVLRTLDQDPELNLEEMLATVGDDRTAFGEAFNKDSVVSHPTIFPLLHALVSGEVDGVGASEKRRVSEWGERALLEAGLARLISQGPAKL